MHDDLLNVEKKGGRSSIIDQYWVETVSHTTILYWVIARVIMYIFMHTVTVLLEYNNQVYRTEQVPHDQPCVN